MLEHVPKTATYMFVYDLLFLFTKGIIKPFLFENKKKHTAITD